MTRQSAEQITEVRVRYQETPDPVLDEGTYHLRLPTDGVRGGARLRASLARPGVVRDALLTLGDILASDLRFRAQDRSDYLAYLLAQGKRATQAVWDAQKAFLDARYGEAAKDESPLDPVVNIDDSGLSIEVFSRDESAYARLQLKAGAAYTAHELSPGTTHLDFAGKLLKSVGRLRSYRASTLELGPSEGGTERALRVPHRWLRAFGQVLAASTLPAESFRLAPVDLYNVLLTLRLRKAKKPPRALRYELVPGEAPRLVLEPWDTVLTGTGGVYRGSKPQVVRTWGRNRLAVLARLLPSARSVTVRVVGPGLPAFYILDLGDATLTLALSGWTDSGWAGIATFDLLVPGAVDELLTRQALGLLEGGKTLGDLMQATGRGRNELRQALLGELVRGELVHDPATGIFQRRPLFAAPPAAAQLRYRDRREEQAHRLLEIEGQVQLAKVHDLGPDGTTIEGSVEDRQAHRTFRPSFTIDREGRSTKAACTCTAFRRAGIKEGPCEHMMALRLLFARQQTALEEARATPAGRKLIRAETRTLLQRTAAGRATLFRLSLDDKQVVVRWGAPTAELRMHRLMFASADEARAEYFARLESLGGRGFIDAGAADQA